MIDMTTVLTDERGNPIPDPFEADPKDPQKVLPPLTLGSAVAHALFAAFPDEQNLGWETKFTRGMMAERLRNNSEAELTTEELPVIKRLVGRLYGVAIVMKVIPLIDPTAKPGALA
jgi:hypothetical protein